MKCFNCKREIPDGNIYCVHCGEKLVDKENEGSISNYIVDNQKVYEEMGNKAAQYGTKAKENLPGYIDKAKAFILKNKVASIIVTAIIMVLLIGIGAFNFMQGRPVKESELQAYLVGQNFTINNDQYEIKEKELKSLEITSRKSEKKKDDEIQGKINLDLDNATVVADVDFKLTYNKDTKKWGFNKLVKAEIKNIEPKKELKDSINDLLKDKSINYNYNSINLKAGLLKSVDNVKIDGTGVKRTGSADLKLSNGVVEAKVNVNFDANFNLKEGNWVLKSDYLDAKVIEKENIVANLSDEDKKNFVMTAFTDNRGYNYKYKSGNYDTLKSITLNKDIISTLKVNNFMQYDKENIRAEIQGEAKSGDITKINFSGVIYLKLSLTDNGSDKVEVNIDSVELGNLNLDEIKKDMLLYKIDDKTITVATADTFKLGAETKDSSMFDRICEGTMIINGENKKVKIEVELEYNDKDKKYQWKLNRLEIIKE